jgi:predicted DCC family thiol-disulfide oxidoreductase YuxK
MSALAEQHPNTNARRGRAHQALVLYDGQCPLCIKSAETIKRFDWFHTLHFQNARDVDAIPQREPPLHPERLLQQMHLITPDNHQVHCGFKAFRWIAWRLPALWPVAPLLYLPGVPTLGEKAYLWIARNRYRLVPCQNGVCHLPPRTLPNDPQSFRGLE